MKTILYMAMTINGYIAKENDDTPWSNESWKAYAEMVKRTKNIIIGGHTYRLLQTDAKFRDTIGHPLVVVVSRTQTEAVEPRDIIVRSPLDALKAVENAGFSEALVEGGGGINTSFLQEGLLDEIYLDIDPVIWGRGKKLFHDVDTDADLALLDVGTLSDNLVRLHYSVIKK